MQNKVFVKNSEAMPFTKANKIDGIPLIDMFRDEGRLFRSLRFLLLQFKIPLPSFFYNKDLLIYEADVFVIQDAGSQIKFLKWVKNNHPNSRVILWYWNTVEERIGYMNPQLIPNDIEIWSYSRYDCDRYRMKYNTTFYPYERQKNILGNKCTIDVFFVGKDKGRLKDILYVQKQLENKGLKTEFYICATRTRDKYKRPYKKYIDYDEIVNRINNSKALLDFYISPNAGVTVRPLEALFWRKKLITNRQDIIYEDYYSPQNVFIIGKDDFSDIFNFVNSEYVDIFDDVRNRYSFGEWMSRF